MTAPSSPLRATSVPFWPPLPAGTGSRRFRYAGCRLSSAAYSTACSWYNSVLLNSIKLRLAFRPSGYRDTIVTVTVLSAICTELTCQRAPAQT
eukprot:905139-Rhodomonas_salina.6